MNESQNMIRLRYAMSTRYSTVDSFYNSVNIEFSQNLLLKGKTLASRIVFHEMKLLRIRKNRDNCKSFQGRQEKGRENSMRKQSLRSILSFEGVGSNNSKKMNIKLGKFQKRIAENNSQVISFSEFTLESSSGESLQLDN